MRGRVLMKKRKGDFMIVIENESLNEQKEGGLHDFDR
jgi:hypothetical protein